MRLIILCSHDHIVMVEYGIESAICDQNVWGHTFEQAVSAIKMSAERGLDLCAHFILGLPRAGK